MVLEGGRERDREGRAEEQKNNLCSKILLQIVGIPKGTDLNLNFGNDTYLISMQRLYHYNYVYPTVWALTSTAAICSRLTRLLTTYFQSTI